MANTKQSPPDPTPQGRSRHGAGPAYESAEALSVEFLNLPGQNGQPGQPSPKLQAMAYADRQTAIASEQSRRLQPIQQSEGVPGTRPSRSGPDRPALEVVQDLICGVVVPWVCSA